MERALPYLRALALATVPVCGGFLVYALWPLHANLQRADVSPLIAKASSTLDALNAPCTSFHGSVSCGPIAQMSQTEKNVGIVAAQSVEQVKQSGQLITAAANNINLVGEHVSDVADSLKGTATAATETLQAAQTDLETANQTIAASKPLLDAATLTVGHADALVESPDVTRFLKASADTSQQFALIATQGAGIAADVHKEADALVAPKTFWQSLRQYSATGVNVACLVTHSCPF